MSGRLSRLRRQSRRRRRSREARRRRTRRRLRRRRFGRRSLRRLRRGQRRRAGGRTGDEQREHERGRLLDRAAARSVHADRSPPDGSPRRIRRLELDDKPTALLGHRARHQELRRAVRGRLVQAEACRVDDILGRRASGRSGPRECEGCVLRSRRPRRKRRCHHRAPCPYASAHAPGHNPETSASDANCRGAPWLAERTLGIWVSAA